jgi:hypothetical protein
MSFNSTDCADQELPGMWESSDLNGGEADFENNCRVSWKYIANGVMHSTHICGSHDTDGAHICWMCDCWVTDSGLKIFGKFQ